MSATDNTTTNNELVFASAGVANTPVEGELAPTHAESASGSTSVFPSTPVFVLPDRINPCTPENASDATRELEKFFNLHMEFCNGVGECKGDADRVAMSTCLSMMEQYSESVRNGHTRAVLRAVARYVWYHTQATATSVARTTADIRAIAHRVVVFVFTNPLHLMWIQMFLDARKEMRVGLPKLEKEKEVAAPTLSVLMDSLNGDARNRFVPTAPDGEEKPRGFAHGGGGSKKRARAPMWDFS